ncbi:MULTISPECIES: cysteine hydrolase family protein [unclassified Pseudomonas]|uniref:cysteine hydrolase family protein n=1 Tax=unclassified Pseudomonas TaxID=196821 RepID=UPI0025E287B6|nr:MULTISPECIES: cysteine hydrolase [unclassified Pseudomonas]
MVRGFDQERRPALLISECQRGVIDPELSAFPGLVEQVQQRDILGRISRLAQSFRAAGLPVIHLHVVHKAGYIDVPETSAIIVRSMRQARMLEGSADVEPAGQMRPHPGDVVHARSFSLVGFHGTELDAMLRHMGVKTLVPVGVSTNVAISGTALCGSDLGYQVVIPVDCIAGASAETHDFIVKNQLPLYSTLTDSQTLIATLEARSGTTS